MAARLPLAGWSVTIRVSGDRELHRLNRDFLGEDEPTDVLSFPSGDAEASGYLGDIVISWPAVLRQAAAFTRTPEVEAALYEAMLDETGWEEAGVCDVPVLRIMGAQVEAQQADDNATQFANLKRHFPRAESIVQANSTHSGPFEHPEVFEATIRAFYASIGPNV